MSGGQVIYLPQSQPGLSDGFGQGFSNAVQKQVDLQIQNAATEDNMKALDAMRQAGTREKAMNILSSGLVKFQNPKELADAIKVVDGMYPPKDDSTRELDVYDAQGNKQKRFIKNSDTTKLNDPNAVPKLIGDGMSLTQPPIDDYYKVEPNGTSFTHLGKFRQDQRPADAFTKGEMDMFTKNKADERATNEEKRKNDNADRAVAAAERANKNQERLIGQGNLKSEMAYVGTLADMLNVKKTTGQDGSVSIDFSGMTPERQKQLITAMREGPALIEKHGGSVLKAATEAAEIAGIGVDKPQPPEVKKPKPEGIVDKAAKVAYDAADAVKSVVKDAAAPTTTLSPKDPIWTKFRSDPAPELQGATLGPKQKNGKYLVIKNGKAIGEYE